MTETEIVAPAGRWLPARLGWRVERRPPPGFAHVLGAAAGAFLVVGVVAFVVEVTSDDPTTPGVLLDLGLVVVALAAGFRAPGPLARRVRDRDRAGRAADLVLRVLRGRERGPG